MTDNPRERSLRASAVISLRADLLTVVVAEPLPPGSRVRLELATAGGPERAQPTGKVVGVARGERGLYTLDVRLHSLSRTARADLEELAAETSTRGDGR